MRKILVLILAAVLLLTLTACAKNKTNMTTTNTTTAIQEETSMSTKKVAKDGAMMQTDNPAMPTRVIENGTKINMHFGDTVIPGVLNDSDTAKALIEKLPYTVHMSSYSHDFCGTLPEDFLPYNEDEVHYGWLNGDIDYAIDAPYFTILHSDEENSEQYGYQVNIGVITCELAKIRELSGSYDVLIELAENEEEENEEMKVDINIGGTNFSATLEDNAAAKEFYELVKNEGVTIDMSDYSGFEKVGSLGHTLTSDDKQTTTKAGDIVLYQSNQLVLFYGSNSWSYTKLGKIDNLSGWEEALGSGDITAEFSVR